MPNPSFICDSVCFPLLKLSVPVNPPPRWRPAGLPRLLKEDLATLAGGGVVQSQVRHGSEGSGYVVQDLEGTAEAVWSLLTDYARYDQIIDTVRKASVRAGSTAQASRATFVLSKFLIEVSVLHLFSAERQHLRFTLDSASTNIILKDAEGFWFVENR